MNAIERGWTRVHSTWIEHNFRFQGTLAYGSPKSSKLMCKWHFTGLPRGGDPGLRGPGRGGFSPRLGQCPKVGTPISGHPVQKWAHFFCLIGLLSPLGLTRFLYTGREAPNLITLKYQGYISTAAIRTQPRKKARFGDVRKLSCDLLRLNHMSLFCSFLKTLKSILCVQIII